jgi:hypothetical protein
MSTGGVICLFIDLGMGKGADRSHGLQQSVVFAFVAINKGIQNTNYYMQTLQVLHWYYERSKTNAQVCCNCFG